MKIAIVKYNAGNTHNVLRALQKLGVEAQVTDDPDALRAADRVIFPGVGEAKAAMDSLRKEGLPEVIRSLERPFLGICLGMQLLCSRSEEEDTECIGVFSETVRRFPPNPGVKIPHVGWDTVSQRRGSVLRGDLPDDVWCYFVHSYYVPACRYSTGLTEYDGTLFSSMIAKDNFYGCQFHPEKSAEAGRRILENFLEKT